MKVLYKHTVVTGARCLKVGILPGRGHLVADGHTCDAWKLDASLDGPGTVDTLDMAKAERIRESIFPAGNDAEEKEATC